MIEKKFVHIPSAFDLKHYWFDNNFFVLRAFYKQFVKLVNAYNNHTYESMSNILEYVRELAIHKYYSMLVDAYDILDSRACVLVMYNYNSNTEKLLFENIHNEMKLEKLDERDLRFNSIKKIAIFMENVISTLFMNVKALAIYYKDNIKVITDHKLLNLNTASKLDENLYIDRYIEKFLPINPNSIEDSKIEFDYYYPEKDTYFNEVYLIRIQDDKISKFE